MSRPRTHPRIAWWCAVLMALLGHWFAADRVGEIFPPIEPRAPAIRRLQTVYAREMQLSAREALPPRAPRQQVHGARRRPAPKVLQPPSSIVAEAPASSPAPVEAAAPASAPDEVATAATAMAPAVADEPGLAAAADSAPSFEWPVSTRIRYRLVGNYRGEVHGHAEVEWLRQGDRYQVHLDVSAALLFSRSMSSEGRITPEGLAPRRYEETTTNRLKLFSAPRQLQVRFDASGIELADGDRVEAVPQVQDTASQFIQFIYLLSTRAALRTPGQRIDLVLALPRRVGLWSYELAAEESVDTPAGPVQALPLRAASGARPGDLRAQIWFAPRLQMLPVRFRLAQSDDVYFDLFIDRLPEQALR